MAAEKRRIKKKDWDESTESSDNDSNISKRLSHISYTKREKQRELRKTKNVLNRLCDSDDSSDEQKKLMSSRPMTFLPIATVKKFSKGITSTSDSSDSPEVLTEKNNSRKKKKLSPELQMEHRKQAKRHKFNSQESKSVNQSKSKTLSRKSKNNHNKFKNTESSDSDSSSSKEFQKPKLDKKRKSKSESSFQKNSVEENAVTDYSHLATPNKSDDDIIEVTKRNELAIKSFVVDEMEKIQRLAENLKENLEHHKTYVLQKNVTVLREAKFFAHKVLRIYDTVYMQIKESGKQFSETYESLLNTCTSNKTPVHETVKPKYSLDSSDEGESEDEKRLAQKRKHSKQNNEDTRNSMSKNVEESDRMPLKSSTAELDTDERPAKKAKFRNSKKSISKNVEESDKILHKSFSAESNADEEPAENTKTKTSKKSISEDVEGSDKISLKVSTAESDVDEESDNSTKIQNAKKSISGNVKSKRHGIFLQSYTHSSESDTEKELTENTKSPNSKKSISENIKRSAKMSLKLSTTKSDVDDETNKKDEIKNSEKHPESDSENEVSACDSDEIFSGNEGHADKIKKSKSDTKFKKSNAETNKTDERGEIEAEDPLRLTSPPDPLTLNESEELFDSTASEIPNTPIKSPVLGKSFRKTMFHAAKIGNTQTTQKLDDGKDDKAKPDSPVQFELPESQTMDLILESTPTEKLIETASIESPKDNNKNDDDDVDKDKIDDDDNDAAAPTDVDELEQRALVDLLQDVDSDQSTYCRERKSSLMISDTNDNEDEDNVSSHSSSRLVPTKKKQPGPTTLPLAAKRTSSTSCLSSKKQNSIFADSSSSDSEDGGDATRALRRQQQQQQQQQLPENSGSRSSRRLLKALLKNPHYLADAKLRARCRVALERLPRSLLVRHARALNKSKRYVTDKKLLSIMNINALESRKKSKKTTATESSDGDDSGAVKNAGKAKKKAREEKKSVKDHLGEENQSDDNSDLEAEDSQEDNGQQMNMPPDFSMEVDAIDEAENNAKEALLKSGSSSNDEDDDEADVDKKDDKEKKKTKTGKNKSNETENQSNRMSDDENSLSGESKSKKKEKAAWKSDEILAYHVTDTESEEEKASKSAEKKRAKDKEKDDSANEEANGEKTPEKKSTKKQRKQRKKRVLNSDSDAEIQSSESESEPSVVSTESEEEKEKTKKKKGRKRRQKSSESETSSGEKKPKSKRKRIKKVETDSDSDNEQDSPGKGRKNIRRVLKDKHVADDTKKAAMDEEERLKRIAERQKLFNEMYDARLAGEAKVDKLVLDVDEESKEELVVVDEELVKRLKPHQAKGIKFMWDACFESLKQMEESDGSGCIIAHCMGLGKTFQVVTLAHTLLTHEETKINTVMVVCPLSTVLNWVNEFKTWLKYTKNGEDIEIYELTKLKKNIERKYMLESWQKTGGVLIIGYEMFRNLTSTGKRMRKAMQESVMRSLVDPGADLVVCDEGHLLKNEDSALSKAMKLVKTRRRVVLTGTPLQNNLKEYHCMVQFVKPNLLGTKKEFLNRFVNPITNGQFDDSTPYDVKLMKKRAHVLHKMLEGSVQRFDYSVLTPFLPPKQEYVIFVRLTDVQIKMYRHYLDNFARRFGVRNGSLFADFQELQRIWTHPYVLRLNAEKVEKANEKKRLEASDSEGSLKEFIDDDSETEVSSISSSHSGSNSDVQCIDSDNEKIPKTTRSTRLNPKDEPVEEVPAQVSVEEEAWWKKFVEDEHFEDLRISTKLTLLFGILKESEQIGDKVLVFSQSLYSLTLIEHFLNLIDQETQNNIEAENLDNHSGTWGLGLDYFRLDGSTSAENRSAWCKIFNNPNNTRARLFLISTRAGGLGINLTAANRVIIFDASWNPSHDVQSIFRIYRFGQKKPCYVYRFLAAGTMEEKIYNRQVTKLSLACRVVDEQQIERHYSNNDLAELYQFESYEGQSVTLNLPRDRLLAEIFLKYKDAVYNYHEHDSLLENKQEEELDEEERKQAWLEYEEEKQGKRQMVNVGNNMAFNQMLMNMTSFPELENIKLLLQKDYPNLPPEHLDTVARQAVFDMYRYVDQQAMNPMLNPFGAAQVPQQNLLGAPAMQQVQQQQINPQSQLLNMLNQPQMNYSGVNHMPAYSGRGRPPKHMSMNNLVNNPMANMRQVQTPMQLQQAQMQALRNNDEIEVVPDRRGPQASNNTAPNMNNEPEE